jgi:predicted secreted acid phosphatase
MLSARPSTIKDRKHKDMKVDFSNPYLRAYIQGFCDSHRRYLDGIRDRLAGWVADSRRREDLDAATEGRAPRPLAATLDIDEVILSNIHMNSFEAPAGVQGSEPIDFHAADHFLAPDGKPWPRDDLRLNPLLPGARELLEELRALEVRIYMITGRLESIRDETVENFVYVGLAAETDGALFRQDDLSRADGPLIMCPDAEYPPPGESVRPYKESRRRAIEETHRITFNIGDQISDLGIHGDAQVHCPQPFYWCP